MTSDMGLTMCNDYRTQVDLDTIRQDLSDIKVRIRFPEGAPNLQPRDDVRITDVAPSFHRVRQGALAPNGRVRGRRLSP